MQTILDEGYTWFLDSLIYKDGLTVQVIEGRKGESPQDLKIGDAVLENTYPIESDESSKRLVIRFGIPIAWQVIDESYTSWDESEERDGREYLQILSQSKYLEYVDGSHGWYKDVVGDAQHYRLWTENEVVDVIAQDPPIVEWQ